MMPFVFKQYSQYKTFARKTFGIIVDQPQTENRNIKKLLAKSTHSLFVSRKHAKIH